MSFLNHYSLALSLLIFSVTLGVNPVMADTPAHEHSDSDHSKHLAQLKSTKEDTKKISHSALSIPDVVLINELGQEVSVRDDLIKNKIVVFNTIYTRCTTVCPVMGIQFSRLQKMLQRRFGNKKVAKDIQLLSISIDPLNDTPEHLLSFKKKFNGGPGWSLLTGTADNIDKLLKATGLFTADPQEHTPITLIGRMNDDHWTQLSGLGPAREIAKLIDDLLARPLVAATTVNEK